MIYESCNGDEKKYLCINPICLFKSEGAQLECYKCMITNHEHTIYIQEYKKIHDNCIENGKIASKELETQQEQIEKFMEKIKVICQKVSESYVSIMKKIEQTMLSKLQDNSRKISVAQTRLNEIINDHNNMFLREKVCFATSVIQNILPNIDILKVNVSEIDSTLEDILASIDGLNNKVNNLPQNEQSQEIKLYNFQSYDYCQEHRNELKKFICTTCQSCLSYQNMELLCKICIEQQHKNHQIETKEIYNFRITSSLQETKMNQKKVWSNFYKAKIQILNEGLHQNIEKLMEDKFDSIFQQQTQSSLRSSIVNSNIPGLQSKIQDRLGGKFNELIRSCVTIIQDFKYDTVESVVQYKMIEIPAFIEKQDLASKITEGINYLLIFSSQECKDQVIYDLSLIKITSTFRLKKSNFNGLFDFKTDAIMKFGTENNYVTFKKGQMLYSAEKIVVNGNEITIKGSVDYKFWYLFKEEEEKKI